MQPHLVANYREPSTGKLTKRYVVCLTDRIRTCCAAGHPGLRCRFWKQMERRLAGAHDVRLPGQPLCYVSCGLETHFDEALRKLSPYVPFPTANAWTRYGWGV